MKQEQDTIRVSKRTFTMFLGMCIGGLAMTAGVSFADGSRSTQSIVGSRIVVPYDGYLMIDSQPITGQREIKFDLFESASGGMPEWTETQTVSLYDGRFSVGLGTSELMTDTLLDAEKLWLAMTIVETNAAGVSVDVPLSGRQAIEPAPFAAWAANSADFDVAGELAVAGDVTVGGDVVVKGPILRGQTSVSTSDLGLYSNVTDNWIRFVTNNGDFRFYTDGGSGTTPDLTIDDGSLDMRGRLDVRGDVFLGDGTDDDTVVSGALRVTEDLTLANDRDIFGTDLIQGHDDLRFRGSPSSTRDDLRVETNGTITIPGNLNVGGDITNLQVREFGSTTAPSSNLVGVGDSICFLTQVKIRGHNQSADESECAIDKSGSGALWQLKRRTSGSGSPTCRAVCLTW